MDLEPKHFLDFPASSISSIPICNDYGCRYNTQIYTHGDTMNLSVEHFANKQSNLLFYFTRNILFYFIIFVIILIVILQMHMSK